MSAFSPGPWGWSDINDETYEPGVLLRGDGIQIGFDRRGGTAVDSRLIAAAPELYGLAAVLSSRCTGCRGKDKAGLHWPECASARATALLALIDNG